jgi:hypothetical protein
MSRRFRILDPDLNVAFPARCVCCGAAPEAESILVLTPATSRKRPDPLRISVPHCRRCSRGTRAVFMAGCVPFVLGFLLIGGIAFVAATFGAAALGLDEMGQPNNANSLVLGAAAGLAIGFIAGFVFELLARVVLLPLFGRALWDAPLVAMQVMDDSDHVAGLTVRPDRQTGGLLLTFSNAEVAAEFGTLNRLQAEA